MVITALLIGFLVSFIGLLAPGMLNMTACNISLERGLDKALRFSLGASLVVFGQSYVALIFAKFLNQNPDIINRLTLVGVFVFFILSIFFYLQTRKKKKMEGKSQKGNYLIIGMGMSAINMLAIPFYLGMGALSESKGWVKMVSPDKYYFIIGTVLGAFALLSTYSYFAKTIMAKSAFIAKNINYLLSALFFILGVVTLVKVLG